MGSLWENTWSEPPVFTPIQMLKKLQTMLRTPTKVEPFETDGKKFSRYLLYENNYQENVVVDVAAKFLFQTSPIDNSDNRTTYELIPFDVKAHENEIFDVKNLHQILRELLKLSQVPEAPAQAEKKTDP
jgi:hypothetical protein